MANLFEDSDSNHSLGSIESDEETNLPSFANIIYSPPKKPKTEKVEIATISPVSTPLALTTGIISFESPKKVGTASNLLSLKQTPETGNVAIEEDSPLKVVSSHKKAEKKGEKLSRKMRQLSESSRMKKDVAEKLEKFKSLGGILGLSKALEEEESDDDSPDEKRLSSINPVSASFSDLPKMEIADNTPSLPLNPPGKTLFVNLPALIEELYPPCYEEDHQEGPLEGLKQLLLTQDSPKSLSHLLTSNLLGLCYHGKACPLSVWQWLFQIMCLSCDQELSLGAHSNLLDLVRRMKEIDHIGSIFCPSMAEIVNILVSLGIDRERLTKADTKPQEENDEVFTPPESIYGNFSRLLSYLKLCVEVCPQNYTVPEVEDLIMLVANLALDTNIQNEVLPRGITLCLNALLMAVPQLDWACSESRLVAKFPSISQHHHDLLYMVRLTTGTSERLPKLQVLLCRSCITALLKDKLSFTHKLSDSEFAKKVLVYYYQLERSTFDYEMCYKTYSILAMLGLFLNRSIVHWRDQKSEREFSQLLGVLSDKIRDDSKHPEKGAVKDMLIRLKLEFEGQKSIMRQTQIKFEY